MPIWDHLGVGYDGDGNEPCVPLCSHERSINIAGEVASRSFFFNNVCLDGCDLVGAVSMKH